MTIGERIKQRRKELKMSQTELAQKADNPCPENGLFPWFLVSVWYKSGTTLPGATLILIPHRSVRDMHIAHSCV